MNLRLNNNIFKKWQLAVVFLCILVAANAWGAVPAEIEQPIAEDVTISTPLQDMIESELAAGTTVDELIAKLIAAGIEVPDIICGLFKAGVEHSRVIASSLDYGLDPSEVAVWAMDCGATQSEVHVGYSTASGNFIFNPADNLNKNLDEYLYNPPSPSQ